MRQHFFSPLTYPFSYFIHLFIQINKDSLAQMKDGVMIVNTSRGPLIDTASVIEGLKKGKIGYLGLDVYLISSQALTHAHTHALVTHARMPH